MDRPLVTVHFPSWIILLGTEESEDEERRKAKKGGKTNFADKYNTLGLGVNENAYKRELVELIAESNLILMIPQCHGFWEALSGHDDQVLPVRTCFYFTHVHLPRDLPDENMCRNDLTETVGKYTIWWSVLVQRYYPGKWSKDLTYKWFESSYTKPERIKFLNYQVKFFVHCISLVQLSGHQTCWCWNPLTI